MRIYLFQIGDTVTINNEAINGLPNSIGKKGVIYEQLENGSYDYRVKLDDGGCPSVKENELTRLEDDDFILKVKVGDTVVKPNGEEAVVKLIDYFHREIECEFADGSFEVISVDRFLDLKDEASFKMEYECEWVGESELSNKELHKQILDEIHDTYVRKNADYGNSFEEQFNEYGLLSAIIRFDDKIRRLKQLNKHEAKVKDESIRDSCMDLANYCIMTIMELDKGGM